MRILPINTFNFNNKNHINKVSTPRFEEKSDTVSFSGIFRNRVEVLTPVKIKSDEINKCIAKTEKSLDVVNKQMRRHAFIVSEMYAMGKENNFLSYTTFGDEKNNEKLIFGKIDENSKIPVSVTQVSMVGNRLDTVKPIKTYNLYADGLFNVQFSTDDGIDVSMTGSKNSLIYYRERERKTGYTKDLSPSVQGFVYSELLTDENGDTVKTFKEVNFDRKDMSNSTAIWQCGATPEETAKYVYNKKTRLWEQASLPD